MKIEITEGLKFAPNCRTILPLEKGQVITLGENGLNRDNLARLIELEVAKPLTVADVAKPTREAVIAAAVEDNIDGVDFRNVTDKSELETLAKETYDIELDKRKSLKNMIAELDEAIAKQGDE
jgi:hypothetical protein